MARLKAISISNILVFLFVVVVATDKLNAQTFTYSQAIKDDVSGVDGLAGSYGIVVSPDDKHVYTSSSTDDAVVVFSRSSTNGKLTFVEVHKDDGQTGGTIDGLADAKRLAISNDGKHIYVPTSNDDALVVFSRNATTGELTYVETLRDGISGVDGLNGAHELVISPDDSFVYSTGYVDDAVAVFSRNSNTGKLTYLAKQTDGVSGVNGLNNVRGIYIAPDGNHLYTASATDDAVAVFSRNTSTGLLTFVEVHIDGLSGVDGLNGVYSIFVSPDNKHVYTAAYIDDAVTVFSRNTTTGALTFVEVHKDASQTGGLIDRLNTARFVTGTADGTKILAVSSSDHALVVFTRNSTTGALTFYEDHVDGSSSVDGLNGARVVAISSDDESVYTVSAGDNAVSAFYATGGALPIELLSFDVELKEDDVYIKWETSSEINNDYFELEKSVDGVLFTVIDHQTGAGTSIVNRQYQSVDYDAIEGGTVYYRLKQVDFDGTVAYFKIESISKSQNTSAAHFNIFPQPCYDELIIETTGIAMGTTDFQVRIYDVYGIVLKQVHAYDFENGLVINTSDIPSGIYFVQVYNESFEYSAQIVKSY